MTKESWEDIHKDFKYESYQRSWKEQDFTYEQTKEWKKFLGKDFKPGSDWAFCAWLRDEKNLTVQQSKVENLIKEYNKLWKGIRPDFGKKNLDNKTYQQCWEERGFTYQGAQKWITIGFKLDGYAKVAEWKSYSFVPQEVESWISIGFALQNLDEILGWKNQRFNVEQTKEWAKALGGNFSINDFAFCAWLKGWKKLTPQQVQQKDNIKSLKKEYQEECNWASIHKGFGEEDKECPSTKFYQQWKTLGINYPKAKLWIKEGFLPYGHREVRQWLKIGFKLQDLHDIISWKKEFTPKQTEIWTKAGLTLKDHDFAYYLRKDSYQPDNLNKNNLGELRKKISWQDIHQDFTFEKRSEWEKQVLSHQEAREWFRIGFDLDKVAEWKSYGFTSDQAKGWTDIGFNHQDLQKIRPWRNSGFNAQQTKEWKSIDFKVSEAKNWRDKNFNAQQTKEWIKSGAKINDYEFVSWLKVKGNDSEWIANYQEDYQILSDRFKSYGLCSECNQPNTGEQWCKDCSSKHFKEDFESWTSNNQEIDKFIQKYQLLATDKDKFIEWIPYGEFDNLEYLAQGGFGKVYKAKWTKGNIHHWDAKKKKWHREKDYCEDEDFLDSESKSGSENEEKTSLEKRKPQSYKIVILKNLTNSQNLTDDFLKETANHKIIDDWFNNIVSCYGISRDPRTGNYLMIMQYIKGGDLRKYLKDNKNFGLKDKLEGLANIAQGLKDIHAKNLVHRDFHSGNILGENEEWYNTHEGCLITDLGLCKPADEINDSEIYGVLPYVAPEVLNGLDSKLYTQKADVYSFGVVAYELFANASPYLNREYDRSLALDIVCDKLRPNLKELKIPELLKNLIQKCWNPDPAQRPTANELEKTLRDWQTEIRYRKDTEFTRQLQKVEKEYNQLSQNMGYKRHPTEVLTSRRLDFKNLSKPKSSKKIINSNLSIASGSTGKYKSREQELDIDIKSLSKEIKNLANRTKRQLSITSQTESLPERKSTKLDKEIIIEEQQYCSEPMEIDRNWQNIHLSFTSELVQNWINHGFTYEQTQDWINIGFQPQDYDLVNFVKNNLGYDTETVLNNSHLGLEVLRNAYERHLAQQKQNQIQVQIIHNPPK